MTSLARGRTLPQVAYKTIADGLSKLVSLAITVAAARLLSNTDFGILALAMTTGIFLPAFGFSLLFHDRLEKVVENVPLRGFLEGVAAGVVGLIAATTVELAATVGQRLPSLPAGLIVFGLALALLHLWRSRLNVVLAITGAGFLGWLLLGVAG